MALAAYVGKPKAVKDLAACNADLGKLPNANRQKV